ncbi:glycosyltransferase [Anabaena sp. UHCC 0399]|uniref:glycosyltransferase n=1 Tax=Anabaena sp. UHCC 0399 TaxID=3110238 RepID=UPI002B20759F|nr:glycosyltransferase [Anabaena sp. UHCC 0399]MEA5566126.1 glycosyltransferase [Anabaena sp. UHCC 0399]
MPNKNKSMNIHLWLPQMFSFNGGIQIYSAFLFQALQNLYPDSRYEVFIKHEVETLPSITYLPQTRFHFTGGLPLKIRTPLFAAQIIGNSLIKKPDLVLATHLNFAIASLILKRLLGIPYWVVAHGIEAWNIKNRYLQTALMEADLILAVSSYTRDRLLKEQNLDPKKVTVLPNTFDAHRFQPAPKPAYLLAKHSLKPTQPVILTVARLSAGEQYKGYDRVLQAIPQIRQSIPDVHYVIVGEGSDRTRIEELIAELNLQDCVTLAGFVPDEKLCDYYNLCDVFAMPSQGEGFGIVYLEALACGKAVLGGNQDGAIDALCHGKLGVLVNPDDVQAIAQNLTQIIIKKHPNSLIYQPDSLRRLVIDTFGFEAFQSTLYQVFQTSHLYSPNISKI